MAEGSKPGGFFAALGGFFQQWQVIVAAVAAATALWFGFAEQRRKELDVNRAAVDAAKADAPAFLADPHNTLVEYRATYPYHAFCAALGYFVAEAGRQTAAGAAGAGAGVKAMGDAIAAQIERIGAEGGLSLPELERLAAGAAGDGTPDTERCPTLRAPFGLRARAAMREDCRLLVETYAQAQCQAKAAELGARDVAEEAAAAAPATAPSAVPPAPGAAAPPEACGPAPPTVYLQFAAEADRAAAERVRRALEAGGWPAPALELVEDARTGGDVRYYWPEQESCARGLAAAAGALLEPPRELATISLAGRYRNLPRGRLELWLPAGVEARASAALAGDATGEGE